MCIRDRISGICNQFLNGKTDQKLFCNEMKDRLNDYNGSRYELRNQPEAVEGRVNNMLDKLPVSYTHLDVYKRQILDISMEELNGIKLGRKLKEKFPDVKLVYITSYRCV